MIAQKDALRLYDSYPTPKMRSFLRPLVSLRSLSVNPNPKLLQFSLLKPSSLRSPPIRTYISPFLYVRDILSRYTNPSSPITKDYLQEFRIRFQNSRSSKDKIQKISAEIDDILEGLESIYESSEVQGDIAEKVRVYTEDLQELYYKYKEIPKFYPGLISERLQKTLSILAKLHWLETGELLSYEEVEEKLDFDINIRDYLLGICLMTNDLPLYAAGKVVRDDVESARRAMDFVKDLDAGFNLISNEFFGVKENLTKLEEICFHAGKGIPFPGEMVRRLFAEGTTPKQVMPQGSCDLDNNGEMFSAMYKMMK